MTLDHSGPPSPAPGLLTRSPAHNASAAIDPAGDLDLAAGDPWYGPSIADGISLSPSAAKRLSETARSRAFLMPELAEARCMVDAGDGRSIVLDGGLYRIGRTR